MHRRAYGVGARRSVPRPLHAVIVHLPRDVFQSLNHVPIVSAKPDGPVSRATIARPQIARSDPGAGDSFLGLRFVLTRARSACGLSIDSRVAVPIAECTAIQSRGYGIKVPCSAVGAGASDVLVALRSIMVLASPPYNKCQDSSTNSACFLFLLRIDLLDNQRCSMGFVQGEKDFEDKLEGFMFLMFRSSLHFKIV